MNQERMDVGQGKFACTAADIDAMGAGLDDIVMVPGEDYCEVCGFEFNITQRVFGCPFQNEPDHIESPLSNGEVVHV